MPLQFVEKGPSPPPYLEISLYSDLDILLHSGDSQMPIVDTRAVEQLYFPHLTMQDKICYLAQSTAGFRPFKPLTHTHLKSIQLGGPDQVRALPPILIGTTTPLVRK